MEWGKNSNLVNRTEHMYISITLDIIVSKTYIDILKLHIQIHVKIYEC